MRRILLISRSLIMVAAVSEITGPIWGSGTAEQRRYDRSCTEHAQGCCLNNGMSLEDAFESFYTQAEVEFQMAQA